MVSYTHTIWSFCGFWFTVKQKMLDGDTTSKPKNFWRDRPWRVGLLIGVILIAILLAVILPVLLTRKTICNSPTCIGEAARINRQIAPHINPCDDFYQFACGSYLKTAETGTLEPFKSLLKHAEDEIATLYSSPIEQEDHYMVQQSKKLFKACMNTTEIERDSIQIIKGVLEIIGGWPVIKGSSWDDTKFDWLQATYKLRELGYPFEIFLDLKVNSDPRNNTRFILEVRIPYDLDEATDSLMGKKHSLKTIALAFGQDVDLGSQEMRKLYQFAETISHQMSAHRGLIAYPVYTIEELHANLGFINWLEFVNNVSGPAAQISMKDSVMVVESGSLRQRFDLLAKTSKRTQANYMMWKVVQHMIPYLGSELSKLLPEGTPKQPRLSFCLKEIQNRFAVSPIDILYARKYLPKSKRKKVEQLVTNMKEVFLGALATTKWMSMKDQKNVEDKARDLAAVIGEPGDYFAEKRLDELNVDMRNVEEHNFLNLLSQLNRNYLSLTFGKIRKTSSEAKLNKRDVFPLSHDIYYYPEYNLLRIPASQLQNQIFDENRPNYINYGILGKQLGKELSGLLNPQANNFDKDGNRIVGWSQETEEGFGNTSGCLIKSMDSFKKITFDFMTEEMEANIIGVKVAYNAYKQLVKSERDELKLEDMNYSPEQLFWVSTVSCYPNNTSEHPLSFLPDTRDLPRNIVYATVRNNPQFAKDFNCTAESPMNPVDKCEMI